MYNLTIAIITYNRSNYLIKMLDSIQKQTYKDFYAIIYDNGSTDNTYDAVQPFLLDNRFSYHKEPDNTREIMNIIFGDCKTEYLSVVHDDDIMLPEMVEKEIQMLESNEDVSIVSTNMNYIDINDNIINSSINYNNEVEDIIIKSREFINCYMKGINIACPTVMFRMSIIHQYNILSNVDIGLSTDTFLWLELSQLPYDFYIINKALYNYRIHDGQDSKKPFEMIPLLKIPIYNLLVRNKYPKATILSWLKYVNGHIIYLYSSVSQKFAINYFKIYKDRLFLHKINDLAFLLEIYNIVYLKKFLSSIIKIIKKIIKCVIPYGLVRFYQKIKY